MLDKELVLQAAEQIKKGWCQINLAQDKDGLSISPYDPSAVKWCVIGAMMKISQNRLQRRRLSEKFLEFYSEYLSSYNICQTTVEPVIERLKEFALKLEKERAPNK